MSLESLRRSHESLRLAFNDAMGEPGRVIRQPRPSSSYTSGSPFGQVLATQSQSGGGSQSHVGGSLSCHSSQQSLPEISVLPGERDVESEDDSMDAV